MRARQRIVESPSPFSYSGLMLTAQDSVDGLKKEVSRLQKRKRTLVTLSLIVVVLVSLIVLIPLLVHATTYLQDDFENFPTAQTPSGSWAQMGTPNQPVKSSTQAHGGTYSAYVSSSSGQNIYCDLNRQNTFSMGSGAEHLSVWVYITSAGREVVLSTYDGVQYDLEAQVNDSSGTCTLYNQYPSGSYTSVGTFADNSWHHIEAYRSSSSAKIHYYIDGVNQSSSYTGLNTGSPNGVFLGDVSNADQNMYGTVYYDDILYDNAAEPAAPNAPTYKLPTTPYNTTYTNYVCNFGCEWVNGTNAISMVWLRTNATGSFANTTCTLTQKDNTSDWWANSTVTLTSTIGALVDFRWAGNGTGGESNETMANQTLTTTSPPDYPPTYTTIGSSTAHAGQLCTCYTKWAANSSALSGFIFSTDNGSAAYTNQTWTSSMPSGWGNFTFRLNVTVGTVIHWKEYCNDTANGWNTTSVQTITATYYETFTVVTTTHSWSLNPGDINQTVTGTWINLTVTSNADFDVQVEGSGALSDGAGHTIALSNIRAGASVVTSSVALTTSFQNVTGLTNQASCTSANVAFSLWATAPSPQRAGTYTYVLTVQILQYPG